MQHTEMDLEIIQSRQFGGEVEVEVC